MNLAPVFRAPVARRRPSPPPRPTVRASRNPFRTWHADTYFTDNLIISEDD